MNHPLATARGTDSEAPIMNRAMPAKNFRERILRQLGMKRGPRAKDWLAVLFLILLSPVFFWRETLGWLTLGDQDAVFWFFPAYKFAAEQIRSGALPLWNPYQYGGLPFFAEWQSGTLDPLNWIYWIGATSRTLTLSLELSFAVGLLAMFSYARSLSFTRRASIFAAVVFALSGFLVGRTLYPGFLRIVALLPLVLCFTERLRQRGRWRDAIFGALIVAWQIFAAHPQPLIYSSLLACAYAIFKIQLSDLKRSGSFLLKFALMFIGGIGLAAIQLFPAFEFAIKSVRQEWPFELFTLHSLHPLSLLVTLFPFFHGEGRTIYGMAYWGSYWHHNEAQIYLGALALALAATGAIAAWRVRWRTGMFWSLVAIAGTVMAMGKYSGIAARLLYHVPLISHFRSPNRHWMEVTMAVAILAGYTVDRLLKEESRFLARCAQGASVAIALLVCAFGGVVLWQKDRVENWLRSLTDLHQLPPGFLQSARWEFLLPMILAVCACLTVIVFAQARNRGRWFAVLLALLIVDFNLYAAFAPINNPEKLETLIGSAMPTTLTAEQAERVPLRYHIMLNPETGEFSPFWFYGHEMMPGYDPVLNERQKVFSGLDEAGRCFNETMLDPQDHTLDLFNVRYVFIPPTFFKFQPIELSPGAQADFSYDENAGDTLAITSSLANAAEVADNQEVAEVTIKCGSSVTLKTALRAGRDTAEWAYDRADVRNIVKHHRAPIAESQPGDAANSFQAHAYLARIRVSEGELKACRTQRTAEIRALPNKNVTLSIKQVALEDSRSSQTTLLTKHENVALNDSARWRALSERSPSAPYRKYRIYENLRTMPRAWLTTHAQVAYEGDQLKMIRGHLPGFDPRATALVDHETAAKLDPSLLQTGLQTSAESSPANSNASVLHRTPTNLVMETEAAKPSLLVMSEMFYPGWQAKVDGREVDLLRVNYNLRGVSVEAGKHRVELSYRPRALFWGAVVTLATALCLLAIWVWEKRIKDADAAA